MTSIGFKKMNWVTKKSAWQDIQLAKQKRKASAERINRMNSAAAGFQVAQTMQSQGIGELAAQSAQSRLQTKVKEMQAEMEQQYASFSKLA
ncbi:hypothetical protein [Pelagibacterium lacus]|uniref:Uncharacterized protein n=1 Tax=Pelagibacterium lacus TaxID=2282655 RepID=A0A369W214_9HYPH|nr:hypothetical protein [Pelagibacterium lacus]RDE08724.1 hypothetical protein DVH29_09785 [Pelagibacterium lacus]